MAPRPNIILPDLTGRRAVVTGGNSGLGLETARRLAAAGADVVLTARDSTRGNAAARDIRSGQTDARVSVETLDLADLGSVADFAQRIVSTATPVDILVNNAGIMAVPERHTTTDGFELQFGTNHLGHFALTLHLLPALLRSAHARVVTLTSLAHWGGRLDFDDLQSARRYSAWGAYSNSKLANLLFARELQRRSDRSGWGILSAAAHPGLARTNLQTSGPRMGKRGGTGRTERVMRVPGLTQDAAAGALPTLAAATGAGVLSGDFYAPGNAFETTGAPRLARASRASRSEELADMLWAASERLVGARFPPGS